MTISCPCCQWTCDITLPTTGDLLVCCPNCSKRVKGQMVYIVVAPNGAVLGTQIEYNPKNITCTVKRKE